MNQKNDRRSKKTRQAIVMALVELMNEKNFQSITIQEIIDKADVGRSTFYSHFETKMDLLEYCVETFLDLLYEQSKKEYSDSNTPFPIATILQHVFEHKFMIKGLLCTESEPYIIQKTQTYWYDKLSEYISTSNAEIKVNVPPDLLSYYITSTMLSMLKWWLNNGCKISPKDMETYFYEVMPF
jgi:AcrR family transcriptional regulator